MNQQTTKTLRKLFMPSFPIGDSRNKTDWRRFKKTYNGLPWGARHLFMNGMKQLKKAQESAQA